MLLFARDFRDLPQAPHSTMCPQANLASEYPSSESKPKAREEGCMCFAGRNPLRRAEQGIPSCGGGVGSFQQVHHALSHDLPILLFF